MAVAINKLKNLITIVDDGKQPISLSGFGSIVATINDANTHLNIVTNDYEQTFLSTDISSIGSVSGTFANGSAALAAFNTLVSGESIPYTLISAATTNATVIKASAGTLYSVSAAGGSANRRFIKFYNKATSPTVGTDTPVMTIMCTASTVAPIAVPFPEGVKFSSGIGIAITANAVASDTTVVAAGDVILNLTYA